MSFGLACFQEAILLLYLCKVKDLSSFSVPVTFRRFMCKKKNGLAVPRLILGWFILSLNSRLISVDTYL